MWPTFFTITYLEDYVAYQVALQLVTNTSCTLARKALYQNTPSYITGVDS